MVIFMWLSLQNINNLNSVEVWLLRGGPLKPKSGECFGGTGQYFLLLFIISLVTETNEPSMLESYSGLFVGCFF